MFTKKDITKFYKGHEELIKETTVNWRIHSLIKKGVVQRIGGGRYSISNQKEFPTLINSAMMDAAALIQTQFPFLDFCIWDTLILNNLSQNQSNLSIIVIETEKDSCEAIFNLLQENEKNVYLNPSQEIFDRYVTNQKEVIVTTSLITEAPVKKQGDMTTITLEKLLVDLFCDRIVLSSYAGIEMRRIFKHAFLKYQINESTLLRYAARRGKKHEIEQFIKDSND